MVCINLYRFLSNLDQTQSVTFSILRHYYCGNSILSSFFLTVYGFMLYISSPLIPFPNSIAFSSAHLVRLGRLGTIRRFLEWHKRAALKVS
jgi:hypothetical protein